MKRALCAVVAGSAFALMAVAGQPAATPPAAQPAAPAKVVASKPFDPLLVKVRATLDEAANGGDLAKTTATIGALWDWTCVNVPTDNPEVFLEVGAAQLLMTDFAKYTGDKAAMLKFLRSSPRLTNALVYQMSGGAGDEPGAVLTVLAKLREKFPAKQLEDMANLTAAICVVYDKPVVKQVNENQGVGVSPTDAFEYYTRMEGQMVYSPRTMPTELLIYMIDPGAKLDELGWALNRYSGQREIGPRYSEIHYDNDAFKRGKEKKIDKEGFTLQNIKKYGGICADQAHFASTVGKAIGVPAVVDSGQGSGVGHAWLGFLKIQGHGAEWNFDAGRYKEYEDIRGSITDPQTGESLPDGTLALTAEAMGVADVARQASTAMVDAAGRLAKISGSPASSGLEITVKTQPRTAKVDDRLGLLRASLSLFSGNHRAWNALRAMASAKELTLEQKKSWAAALQAKCGDKYPDFTLAVLVPMVETIDDFDQQGTMWDGLYKKMRSSRPDLATEVLIEEGKMWDKAVKPDKAYDCYTAAAYQFITKSPASVEALELCERMLKAKSAAGAVLPLWAVAWKKLTKPQDMAQEFLQQSNWYKVGSRYCSLLEIDGQDKKAEVVRKALGEDDASVARRERRKP